MHAYFARLRQHSLYIRLLVLLLCISLSVILIISGALFLVDYIPVIQSASKKITEQQLLWKPRLDEIARNPSTDMKETMAELDRHYIDLDDEDFSWLMRQNSSPLVKALKQVQQAQKTFQMSLAAAAPSDVLVRRAQDVVAAYASMESALDYDVEVKQSVIALLQLVGLALVVSCIVAVAIGGRRLLVDRMDRLSSFVPDSLVGTSPVDNEDEFFQLEQKVYGATTRLESTLAETTWANQTNERLRSMVRSQDFLFRFVEIINNENVLSETTLRKLMFSIEKALNASNSAIIFTSASQGYSAGQSVFSSHAPDSVSDEMLQELSIAGSMSYVTHNADLQEVSCLAVAFSSSADSLDVLLIETERERSLEDTEIQVVEVAAQLLSMAMGYQARDQEGRRIALLEERAAIARELHDSLAQSLSFMKIQIARLQANGQQNSAGGNEVIRELREGLDTAYRELRELLATFRVHMDVRGLKFAIQSAIDEFSQRSSLSISLDNRLVNCRLTVNEEFHILHVVREALSNIVRHSGATHVAVALAYQSNGTVMVTIDDDGVGYKPAQDGQDHYGHTIMKERALSLGGDIEVRTRRNGGTRVRLVFTPKLPQ